jgi:tRNA dimethylallyltransferase
VAEQLARRGAAVEIVNADAMQLYRGMDIGTAKASEAERRGIPHHLFDVLDVTEEASVARYQREARQVVEQITARGALPVLVGGSGLYVSSVLFDFEFPGTDAAVRADLERELAEHGATAMHRRLAAVDPAAADGIGPHNGRRLVRALEVITITGRPFGAGLPSEDAFWRPTVVLGRSSPRDVLVDRLDRRVEGMWRAGMLDEVSGLLERGLERGVTASRAIGYAQAAAQLRGELGEAEAIAQTQALTRRYARRQVSWFKRYPATWLDSEADAEGATRVALAKLPA